jgi:choline dehydrogenase-like flavoprotein
MFEDARTLPAKSTIECDICIVGAGPVGMALALQFAETSIRVCLLEIGGFNQSRQAQELMRGETSGRPSLPLHWTRLARFGGTTGWWGGECRPFDPLEDLAPRPWLGHCGWPIAAGELAMFEPDACAFCGLGKGPFDPDGEWLPDHARLPLDPSRFATKLFRYAIATDLGHVHRARLEAARNIRGLLHATTTRLKPSHDRRRIEAVEFSAHPGVAHTVRTRYCVLAAGGIENARLLLASGGLGNDHDQVGRCFMDHLYLDDVATFTPSPRSFSARPYARRAPSSSGPFKAALAPTAAVLAEAGSGNCCIKLATPLKRRPAILAATELRHGLTAGYFPRSIGRLLIDLARDMPGLLAELAELVRHGEHGALDNPRELAVAMVLEQLPNPDSRVVLSSRSDCFGRPMARLDWRLMEADRHAWQAVLAALGEDLQRHNLGRLTVGPGPDTAVGRLRPACHHMGTTRMSDRPQEGVVDRNCRVHGLSNLFVAGSSVFPTGGHANPVLTAVTLALRLAHRLTELAHA